MHFWRYIIAISFIIGVCYHSTAQDTDIPYTKHIRRSQTRDPYKLANALTHGLNSDQEKVKAIHDWIASNIRYDVGKWLSFDYRVVPLKKILRKRKAICVGYSQLFELLCKCAGITCITVPGYDKDIMVDVGDKEYLDEHIWNAVFVDGYWKLVDVCWDAGSIKPTRRTVVGFFVHFFSGGKRDIVKYHPHFVRSCSEFYCMKNGSFFSTDHLPLNPIWQLNQPTLSIGAFEKDSSYYYKKYVDSNSSSHTMDFEGERQKYMSLNETDKAIEDGLNGYDFNHKNHYEPMISYMLMAGKALKVFDPVTNPVPDTTVLIAACDTAINLLTKAQAHNDTAGRYMITQRIELMANNAKKRSILFKQNTKLINSTRNTEHELIKGENVSSSLSDRLEDLIVIRNKAIKAGIRNNVISHRHHKSNKVDSAKCIFLLNILDDTVKKEQQKLDDAYSYVDSLLNLENSVVKRYSDTDARITNLEASIITTRFDNYDDLDYEIRKPKDGLIRVKYPTDSLIFSHKKFLFAPLFSKFNVVTREGIQLQRNYVNQLKTIKRLASDCLDKSTAEEMSRQVLAEMKQEFNNVNETDKKFTSAFRHISTFLRAQTRVTNLEGELYQLEKDNEYVLYRSRKSYIYAHANGLLRANRYERKNLALNKRSLIKLRAYLKKRKPKRTPKKTLKPLKN